MNSYTRMTFDMGCGSNVTYGMAVDDSSLDYILFANREDVYKRQQYNFKSQYTFDYNLAFASYRVAMLPVIIAYICAQKYSVAGLTQGAVKT